MKEGNFVLMHIVVDSPDDQIADSRLPVTVSYLTTPSADDSMKKVTKQGEIVSYDYLSSDDVCIDVKNIQPNQVILFQYPSDADVEEVTFVHQMLKSMFPDNIVLALTNDTDFLINNPNEAVDLLERMIAHIKVSSGAANQIILH